MEIDLGKVVGSKIHNVTGTPAADLGLVEDWAMDAQSGDVWEKTDAGWQSRGNIKGAPGPAGDGAYEQATEGGYTGTEAEFNAQLAGLQNGPFVPMQWKNGSSVALGSGAIAGSYGTIALGPSAKASGERSIALGISASTGCYTLPGPIGHSAIAIGDGARATESNSVALGRMAAATDVETVAVGCYAQATSPGAIAFGVFANSNNTKSVAIGHSAVAAGTYAFAAGPCARALGYSTALGYNASATDLHSMQLGDSTVSSLKCAVPLSTTSDIRDKTDVEPVQDGAVEMLKRIEPITYLRNPRTIYIPEELSPEEKEKLDKFGLCEYDREAHAAGEKKGARKRVGVSAQQVQEAMKAVYGDSSYMNLVNDNLYDYDPKDIPGGVESQLSVNYEAFVPLLIKAVQEMSARIDKLEGRA